MYQDKALRDRNKAASQRIFGVMQAITDGLRAGLTPEAVPAGIVQVTLHPGRATDYHPDTYVRWAIDKTEDEDGDPRYDSVSTYFNVRNGAVWATTRAGRWDKITRGERKQKDGSYVFPVAEYVAEVLAYVLSKMKQDVLNVAHEIALAARVAEVKAAHGAALAALPGYANPRAAVVPDGPPSVVVEVRHSFTVPDDKIEEFVATLRRLGALANEKMEPVATSPWIERPE